MQSPEAERGQQGTPILVVEDLTRTYVKRGVRRPALDGVSFSLERGRTIAVVGESGAGKSTLARLVAGLERPDRGAVRVHGAPPRVRSGAASPVQMVFQHPVEALNRFVSVGSSIAEPIHGVGKQEKRRRVAELLEQVGLDPGRAGEKPARFSGGQLQRIVMARALAAEPEVLLCDEPTSALDVSVQAQIVNLLLALQQSTRFACLLITHDLGVAQVLADDVLVLLHGKPVELTPADEFFEQPREEYSRGLLLATKGQALVRG